ncbi:MAG TPA: peptide-N4-asparagine amidase [Rhodanobacteraceae bacterium]
MRRLVVLAAAFGLCTPVLAPAAAPPQPATHAATDSAAAAPVPHPSTQPCVVTLFHNTAFGDHGNPTSRAAKPRPWTYAPPSGCAGPWARVVLQADFSVNAGRQYDRTVSLWLDGVNLYFGTTREPSADVAPRWHVERDLTDYAALFRHAGHGQTILNNWVGGPYTGVIRGSARLLFYPAPGGTAARRPAARVYGLVGDSNGHPVSVADGKQTLQRTLTLPRNIERAYLDVIAQSQDTDEQWFMCIDDADVARTAPFSLGPPSSGYPIQECGHGNFREVVVSIDGQPAGLAPVYPWIYTGGVDPFLWRPTPDIQTLAFTPYRIDLTPFAGLLDNGKPHTIAVRVAGAHDFFSLAANLLLYTSPTDKVLSGSVTRNTLTASAPGPATVRRHFTPGAAGTFNGNVDTAWRAHYVIAGELATPRGKIITQVSQRARYANRQRFEHPGADVYKQTIDFVTRVTNRVRTTTTTGTRTRTQRLRYPLTLAIDKTLQPGGAFTAAIALTQGYRDDRRSNGGDKAPFWSRLDNTLATHDTVGFNAGGTAITGHHDQYGHQVYRFRDSLGSCYARAVHSRDGAITRTRTGIGCPAGNNRLNPASRP